MTDIAQPRLSGNARGILWMLLAVAAYTAIDGINKDLAARHAPATLILLQSALCALMVLPAAMRQGAAGFRLKAPRLLLVRGGIGFVQSWAMVAALGMMPLAEAEALFQLEAVFLIPIAVLALKERADGWTWAAVLLGLLGALLILRPGTAAFQPGALLAIAAALLLAVKAAILKVMAMSEGRVPALFWLYVVSVLLAAVPGVAGFAPVPPADWGLIVLAAALGLLTGWAMMRAYCLADAVALAPATHAGLPMAILGGVLVFGEWPDLVAWTGIGLILVATLMPARKG